MEVPVLIITYNRFDNVLRILDILNTHGQKRVYISVDDYFRDKSAFDEIEQFLLKHHFKYKLLKWETNVGCEVNVMKGIKWFFEGIERGVILEDDCIPEKALFSFLNDIQSNTDLVNQNVSFLSADIESTDTRNLQFSYLPVYWGWYSNREFFKEFYNFLFEHKCTFKQLIKLYRSPILLKVKLIALLNYLSFGLNKKSVGWDGVMFYYSIITQKPFIIPSISFIKNNGFGNLGSTFTHTDSIPKWYTKIKFAGSDDNIRDLSIVYDYSKNNNFLSLFFTDVTNNNFKLAGSVVKAYMGYKRSNRNLK